MVTQEASTAERRAPLTRERVLRTAMDLADRGGIEALSMRKLGQELGVDAMALYRHVRNKDDLLDGIVEVIVAEIDRPQATDEMEGHPARAGDGGPAGDAASPVGAAGARGTAQGRPRSSWRTWSPCSRPSSTAGSRSTSPTTRSTSWAAGSSGSTRTCSRTPRNRRHHLEEAAILVRALAAYPRVTELATSVSHEGVLGRCDDDVEFAFGLDLILDGLERLRGGARP